MINAGMLNKRITIEQPTVGSPDRDSYGEPNNTWTTFKTVWASVEPLSGKEFWAQQQVEAEVTVRVRIRYLAGVLPKMRISYAERILSIQSVIDWNEEHKELQLMCSEGVLDG